MVNTSSIQLQEENRNVIEGGLETGQRYFVISRGKTKHPKREIRSSEFLIGAGEGCDLRLGGADIPALFCIIKFGQGVSTIESIESIPILMVNGVAVQSHRLSNGDLIEIGPFQLEYRQEFVPSNSEMPFEDSAAKTSDNEVEFDLADLSAEELVDLLEADMNLVEEHEERKQEGLEALAAEVESRTTDRERHHAELETHHNETVEEFVQITNKLCEHVTQLEKRVSLISDRDVVYTSAFSDLLESQRLLSNHLGTLISHLASLEQTAGQSQSSRFAA